MTRKPAGRQTDPPSPFPPSLGSLSDDEEGREKETKSGKQLDTFFSPQVEVEVGDILLMAEAKKEQRQL